MLRAVVVSGLVVVAAAGTLVGSERGSPAPTRNAPSGSVAGVLAVPPIVAPGVFRTPVARRAAFRSVLLPRGGLRPLPGQGHTPCFREGSLPCVPVCTYRVQGGAPGRGGCPALAPQGCLHLAAGRPGLPVAHPGPAAMPRATCGLGPAPLRRIVIRRP